LCREGRHEVPCHRFHGFVSAFLNASGSAQSDLRLMDLNVVALDEHGRPVTDLSADHFQISDAGKPQRISFFRRNSESTSRNQARATGPNQFSNRTGGGARNATVILFDLLNRGDGARGFATKEIVRHLGGLESADSLYLYLLSDRGTLFQVHGVSPEEVPVP
jgi:VWFA-related protein